MKIIDLLNKIANGEEVPKKIKYKGDCWYLEQEFSNRLPYYKNGYNRDNLLSGEEKYYFSQSLNDEVEIIEEKEICHKCHKYPAEYNQTYCEFCLGISKLEEKKIPEKLKLYAPYPECDDTRFEDVEDKINEILDYLDYLKSKGDE